MAAFFVYNLFYQNNKAAKIYHMISVQDK